MFWHFLKGQGSNRLRWKDNHLLSSYMCQHLLTQEGTCLTTTLRISAWMRFLNTFFHTLLTWIRDGCWSDLSVSRILGNCSVSTLLNGSQTATINRTLFPLQVKVKMKVVSRAVPIWCLLAAVPCVISATIPSDRQNKYAKALFLKYVSPFEIAILLLICLWWSLCASLNVALRMRDLYVPRRSIEASVKLLAQLENRNIWIPMSQHR